MSNSQDLKDNDVKMQTEQDRQEQELLQFARAELRRKEEAISRRQPLRFGLPPGVAAPENPRPPQYVEPERKQPEVKEEEEAKETEAEKAFHRFCKNLIGSLSSSNKTKDKEKQIVEIEWVQTDRRRQDEDGKSVPVWKKKYPRIPDADFFNKNMDKLFTPVGYRMINAALTYIKSSFPNHHRRITPFDHISKHMDIFTTLCATLNRINIRVTHGVNDGGLVVQQSNKTLQGCMAYYRSVF